MKSGKYFTDLTMGIEEWFSESEKGKVMSFSHITCCECSPLCQGISLNVVSDEAQRG